MLTINISELLLTVLSFFILMFLLNKLLFKPVISFREQRQKGIDDCFEQERQAKEKLAETQKDLDCRRSESLKQAESIMADARSKAQQEAENIAKQAESQAEEKMQQAARELGIKSHIGMSLSRDAFYRQNQALNDTLRDVKAVAVSEMECDTVFVVGNALNVRTGAVVGTDSNIYLAKQPTQEEKEALYMLSEKSTISIALKACVLLAHAQA